TLAFAGVIVVALLRTGRGEISPEAEIALDGVPSATGEGTPMVEIVRSAVEGTILSMPREKRRGGELGRAARRRAGASAGEGGWGKRPAAKVLLITAHR